MSRKPQRHGNNTLSQQAQWAQGAGIPEPPEGESLQSDEERTLWAQYTSTRTMQDWRPIDLLVLAKIVRFEVQMREEERQIEREGTVVYNQRGTPIQNPRFNVLTTLQKQWMQLIKSLGLTQTASDVRTVNKQGQQAHQTSESVDQQAKESDGLIAPPMQQ